MESIKSLTENIRKEAANVEALKKEKADTEAEICEAVDKNCKEIILPVLQEYSDLLAVIAKALGGADLLPSAAAFNGYSFCDKLEMQLSSTYIGFMSRVGSCSSGIGVGQSCRSTGCKDLRYAPYWVTAECTQETLDKLTEQFCRYLGSCVERLKSTSASLASDVEKLKNILSTSDTVVHRDDGTVEIQLGGKTYIGKVKEA